MQTFTDGDGTGCYVMGSSAGLPNHMSLAAATSTGGANGGYDHSIMSASAVLLLEAAFAPY